jgi:glycosyltransferase involved in cell wall biosynthesis
MTSGLTALPEFQAYLRVREEVAALTSQGRTDGAAGPSAYWAEELEQIDYLADATPLIVRKLRHHAFHITGIRPYDYRDKGDGRRENFEARLQALRELGGDALLVPESPALGGFGYDIGGRRFNVDTLKFYEVLVGMQRGGVLDAIRPLDRPVVCEIGAGWGGFAFQFKTLFPRAICVIVDFPELFLFSATYLRVQFPDARMVFAGASLEGWRDADFVFVPHTRADLIAELPLDLTVNMVSFQEMTDAQVRGYARLAAAAGCPLLYSLNRERSPYNTELESVSDALTERYRLTEIPLLGTDYTSAMKKPPRPGRPAERPELGYRHYVGRLRYAPAGRPRDAASPTTAAGGPRVALGMTLYNNAGHLREALESLLAQTHDDFVLVLLDDASSDATEAIAREYVARDPRVRYHRHQTRQAMIATWREVVEICGRECPSAHYFAWVSDHDRWHPCWLERLVSRLDADPAAVLAYPITRRLTPEGEPIDKGPRLFDTADAATLDERWTRFCHEGVGAGDMVYGLMRLDALRRAGVFRTVLRPDRLLVAELTLCGRIVQVPEVLWFRRQSAASSITRQRDTLVVEGQAPAWFWTPPWLQHVRVLWQEYATAAESAVPLNRSQWLRMLLRYQLTYGWRHVRKTETSHAIGRGINGAIAAKKLTKHHFRHAIYNMLVGGRALWGRVRRTVRRGLYHVLVLMHRMGIRGKRGESPTP